MDMDGKNMDYKRLIETLRDESNCDVLDYIEDAAAAIETLLEKREAAEWISVEEKLPKSLANKVLVCCENGYVGFGHYEYHKGASEWFNLETGEPFHKWNWDDEYGYIVTHWMPLPNPPGKQ